MSDKLTAIKIKYPNGTYSEQILLSVLAENVQVNSTTTLSDALDLIDARIDQIVAPTSSTLTLDEEVRDIRVGKDATRTNTVNYASAGTAVRTQLDQMKASLDGDISDLKNALKVGAVEKNIDNLSWQEGSIRTNNGGDQTSSKRIRTGSGRYFLFDDINRISIENGFKILIFVYSEQAYTSFEGMYNGIEASAETTWLTGDIYINQSLNEKYFRLCLGNVDDSKTEVLDGQNVTFWINTDETLQKPNMAANAKSVNNAISNLNTVNKSIINNLNPFWGFEPSSQSAFTLTDENGNILLDINEALDTSKINPHKYSRYINKNYNFSIIDEFGNIAFAFLNGLALTNQRLSGKKVSILGDSISTYTGYIPSGYSTYYPRGNLDNVTKTWWFQLIEELDMVLLKNASWSGSKVSGNSQGSTAAAGCSTIRINDLATSEETPDIIFIYISTNDWSNNVPIGTFTNKDQVPTEGTINEISKAYALMLYKLRNTYPNATLYCITSLEGRTVSGDTVYPIVNSNGDTIHDVNHAIVEIAHIFGCHVIDLNTSGIHFWNVSNYTVDGKLHPNFKGATIIKEVIKQNLLNTYHNL